MEEGRRLAADAPTRSAGDLIGPHLLGRVFRPDPRAWSLSRLMDIGEPPESTLQQTVEQGMESTHYLSNWQAYLVFWRWLKRHREPPHTEDTKPPWQLDIQLDKGLTKPWVGVCMTGGSYA